MIQILSKKVLLMLLSLQTLWLVAVWSGCECSRPTPSPSPSPLNTALLQTAIRSKSKLLHVEQSQLDMSLLNGTYLLISVKPQCRTMMRSKVDICYQKFKLKTYLIHPEDQLNDHSHHNLPVGCCTLWHYRRCVLDYMEQVAIYSLDVCNENDAILVQDSLVYGQAVIGHQLHCPNDHQERIDCDAQYLSMFGNNLATILVLSIGCVALSAAILLAFYTAYLNNHSSMHKSILLRQRIIHGTRQSSDDYHKLQMVTF